MDAVSGPLARFAAGLRFADLPPKVVHDATQRIVDTLGCAVGAADSAPARIARAVAAEHSGTHGARVLGLRERSSPEHAAFANSLMARYLDFNDASQSTNATGGHPSDMIPAILAVADAYGASGAEAVTAVVAGYEANWAFLAPLGKLGWDQGLQIGTGAAIGAGRVLGLSTAQMAHAIALAVTPHVPLRVTRSGELSMWKAGATAEAARGGVFAALLAAKGMTGPGEPFTGRHGLFQQVTGEFALTVDPARDGFHIAVSDIKGYPMANGTHAVVGALVEMTEGLTWNDVERIDVRTYFGLWSESGSEPEKWDPHTRETADHSLPYVMAVGLRDRTVTLRSFRPEAIADPALRPLMKRITVTVDPAFTEIKEQRRENVSEIELVTRTGEKRVRRTGVPRGSHRNPMNDEELTRKFRGLAEPYAGGPAIDRALDALWGMERAPAVRTAIEAWAALREDLA